MTARIRPTADVATLAGYARCAGVGTAGAVALGATYGVGATGLATSVDRIQGSVKRTCALWHHD